MAARLKVFVTSDGLTDYAVAASSKVKALAAWGSHQDLFKTGLAHETDDPALVAAATAAPGDVVRRPSGGQAVLAQLPKIAKKSPAPRLKGPSYAALKKVADLERKLAAAESAYRHALEDLDARHAAERARLEAALSAARRALGS